MRLDEPFIVFNKLEDKNAAQLYIDQKGRLNTQKQLDQAAEVARYEGQLEAELAQLEEKLAEATRELASASQELVATKRELAAKSHKLAQGEAQEHIPPVHKLAQGEAQEAGASEPKRESPLASHGESPHRAPPSCPPPDPPIVCLSLYPGFLLVRPGQHTLACLSMGAG